MNNIFHQRILCWNHTKSISNTILPPPTSTKINYDNQFNYIDIFQNSNVQFFDMDAIDCCLTHVPNALILNLADDNFPGGCVDAGSGAQEESLFRRSNYHMTLDIANYPLKYNEAMYSSKVTIIKNNENANWSLISQNINQLPKVSFVACPGLRCPHTIKNKDTHEIELNPEDVQILKNKIKLIIQIAYKYNHNTIIFGAIGCGAWKNPPTHVAKIFKEVLHEYDGVIQNYYFAIMSMTKNNYIVKNYNDQSLINIFKEVFNSK